MNLQSIRDQLDFTRRTLSAEGHAIEILPLITRAASADGSLHRIKFSSLSDDNADAAIAEQAAHYLIVDALPTSRPILERLGFVRLTDTWPCVLPPP